MDYIERYMGRVCNLRWEVGRSKLPLDPFPPELAGRFRIDRARAYAATFGEKWCQSFAGLMDPNVSPEGWCGYERGAEAEEETVADRYAESWDALAEAGVVRWLDQGRSLQNRVLGRYFEVPKASGIVSRAIGDCRRLNKQAVPPPALQLVGVREIVMLLSSFRNPAFIKFDNRHWFYQLPLPNEVQRLFTMRLRSGRAVEWRCWPESATVLMVVAAAERAGYRVQVSAASGSSPPPYVWFTNSSGKLVGAAIIYYDDVLIIGANTPVRDALLRHLRVVKEEWHVVWKGDVEIVDNQDVVFLGVRWWRKERDWQWAHAQENLLRWADLPTLHGATYGEVARWCGVVVWDWYVSQANISKIQDVLAVSRILAERCSSREDWLRQCSLTTIQIEALTDHLRRIFGSETFSPRHPQEKGEMILATSDASNLGLGGVRFAPNGAPIIVLREPLTEVTQPLHINIREILAGVNTIHEIIDWRYRHQKAQEGPWTLRLGVDNTTARAALDMRFFARDLTAMYALLDLEARLENVACFLEVIHVEGDYIAADCPSSLKDEVDDTRARVSLQLLKKFISAREAIRNRRSLVVREKKERSNN